MGYKNAVDNFLSMDLAEMRPKGFLETILNRQLSNIKAVNDGSGWMAREECPVCNSDNKKYEFSKYEFQLYQCNECSTAFFDRIPLNTNDVYSSEHALKDAKIAYLYNKDYRKVRFAKERVQLLENELKSGIRGRNILDVGCGTGWFLEYAKEKGANCHGVELGKELAKFTSDNLDIPVWNCELQEIQTEKKFDIITMFDLIEHVTDPVELLESAKDLLNKGGIILIFTPQYDSVAIQTMKEKSNLVMPSEHLSYFTKDTIYYLADKIKMDVQYYVTKGIDVGDLKGYYEYIGESEKADSILKMYDLFQPTIDAAQSGNHLRAILVKDN